MTAVVLKQLLPPLQIVFVYRLHHLVDAEVRLLFVPHLQKNPAVHIVHGRPHAVATEEVEAVDLPHIEGVILEPFEQQLLHSVHLVVLVLNVFVEIHPEMGVMPVRMLAVVLFTVGAFRTTAGAVAAQLQARPRDDGSIGPFNVSGRTVDIFFRVDISVEGREQTVPLALENFDMNLRQYAFVEDIG